MRESKLQGEIRQHKTFSDPEAEAFLNIVRTESVLSALQAPVFKASGLSAPLYNILRILRGAGKAGPCVQEIGERMVAQQPDTTRLVDRLERMGLVARKRNREDRRVVNVTITAKGFTLLNGLDRPLRETLGKMLGHMSRRELSALSRLLERAREPHGGG